MATSPDFETSNRYIWYNIDVTQCSQNTSNNTSVVRVRVYVYRRNSGYTTWGPGTVTVTIDNVNYQSSITSSQKITEYGIYIFDKTLTIKHNSDGTKKLPIAASISHSQFQSLHHGFTYGLTTITKSKPVPKPSPVPSATPGPSSATWYTDWIGTTGIYKYRIEVTYHGYDVLKNTSNITVRVYVYRTYVGKDAAFGHVYTRVDGVTGYNYLPPGTVIDDKGRFVYEKNYDIAHNADGTKTIWVSAWFAHDKFAAGENGFNIQLPAVPRRSTIKSITGGTIGSNMTVNVNKSSSSFSTSAWLHVNGSNWYCVANKAADSSFTFKVPKELANHITNNTSATGKLVIRTYYGNQELGDDTWNVNLIVPEDMKITISDLALSTNTTVNGEQLWIKGKSKLGVNISTNHNNAYGASISQYRVSFNGNTFSSKSFWSPVISSSGNLNVVATVIDTRGRSHIVTKTIYVEDYKSPKIEIMAYRCNEYGSKNDDGSYIKLAYEAYCSSLGGSNKYTININYKELGASSSTSLVSTSSALSSQHKRYTQVFNPEKAYEITATIQDQFEKAEFADKIPAAFVLLDFKEGGTGIGMGKMSSSDYTIDLAMDIDLYPSADDQDYRHIGYCGEPITLCFNEEIKCAQKVNGDAWRVNNDGTLFLKAGYTTSDERAKYSIDEFTNWDEYYGFYMSLKPKTFKYNDDLKDKTHIGFIAQDVADSIVDNNLMNDNLSIVNCEENDAMNDGREYSLSYQELIALNVKMIQKHEEEIKELKDKLNNQ